MEFSFVNIITLIIGLVFIYNGYRLLRDGREDVALFFTCELIGGGLIVVSVYPGIFTYVATVLGLEWKARAILVVSNLTLFVLVTYLFNRIGTLRENVSILNEEVSLLQVALEDQQDE